MLNFVNSYHITPISPTYIHLLNEHRFNFLVNVHFLDFGIVIRGNVQ